MAKVPKDPLDQFLAQSAKDWVEEELGPPRKTSEQKDPLPQCSICGKGLSANRARTTMPDGTSIYVCNGPRCVARIIKRRIEYERAQAMLRHPPTIAPRVDDIIATAEEIED